MIGTDTAKGERRFNDGAADQVYRLRPGAYFLSSFVDSPDMTVRYVGRPQLDLTKDTTVVLDACKAKRLRVETDRRSETRTTTLAFDRSWDDTWRHAGTVSGSRLVAGYYADVQGHADDGEFEFGSYWRAYAPLVEKLSVVGGGDLHPVAAGLGSVNLDGTGEAAVVDAGKGTPKELEAAGLSYSYDGGGTWTEAATSQQGGAWTATVNHAGAAGEPVTLKAELTDANGNSVTQLVADAYAVR
ncbi:hypothetical protein ACFWDI_05430 [Streptomyces sp. NPDC060064]|uniref:hypothetical protein n=1 Tax=Streptomyces sp. NPDC060064 TaxID=3347049 RepID=UPI0036B2212F